MVANYHFVYVMLLFSPLFAPSSLPSLPSSFPSPPSSSFPSHPQIASFCAQFWIGLLQLASTLLFFFGWGWSIMWGILFITQASTHRELGGGGGGGGGF